MLMTATFITNEAGRAGIRPGCGPTPGEVLRVADTNPGLRIRGGRALARAVQPGPATRPARSVLRLARAFHLGHGRDRHRVGLRHALERELCLLAVALDI